MAYNPSTGKITPPVSINDIQRAIGQSSGDLGTLCKAPTVNCWAKYKPVQKPILDTTPQYDFTNNRWKTESELGYRPWWQGSTNAQIGGIEPKTVTYLNDLITYYTGSDLMRGWVYNKPSGGANQPYREIDFAHYNHMAPPPLQNFYIQSQIIVDGHFTGSALMSPDTPANDWLTLSDFIAPSFPNGVYFGVVFVQNGQYKLIVTADTRNVAQVYADFGNSGNQLPLGLYDVYPVLCRDAIPITSTYQTANLFLTCPMLSSVQTNIVSRSSTIDVELTPVYRIGVNIVNIIISNNTDRQITNVRWYLTNSPTPPSGGTSINPINAGASETVFGVHYTGGQYFHVSFVYNTSTYFKRLQLMDSTPDPQ